LKKQGIKLKKYSLRSVISAIPLGFYEFYTGYELKYKSKNHGFRYFCKAVMKTRTILYALTLMAYTLSVAHSVIPHHHHSSTHEAESHERHYAHKHNTEHHHHHEKSDQKTNSEPLGHLFFFTHDTNADVLHSQKTISKSGKTKKVNSAFVKNEKLISFEAVKYLVFHPPQDDFLISDAVLLSSSLRAPPHSV
jgi:hypothetical protein